MTLESSISITFWWVHGNLGLWLPRFFFISGGRVEFAFDFFQQFRSVVDLASFYNGPDISRVANFLEWVASSTTSYARPPAGLSLNNGT